MSRWILFAEVPGFYAEAARAANPALAGRPVVVGGDPRKGAEVLSATADAVALGVRAGMAMLDALERCPRARALRTDMRCYREVDARLRSCLRRVAASEALESDALGAVYLEGEGTSEEISSLAGKLRERVRAELELPLRVGASSVKFVARLAAEEAPCAGVRVVPPEEVRSFLGPLPAERLPEVGPRAAERLAALGARTVAEVAALGAAALEAALGGRGLRIHAQALGRGESRLRSPRPPTSLSQQASLGPQETRREAIALRLAELAEGLARALRLEGLSARSVALRLRFLDGRQQIRSQTLRLPARSAAELHAIALELLDRTDAGARPARQVALAARSLVRSPREDRQLSLFPPDR